MLCALPAGAFILCPSSLPTLTSALFGQPRKGNNFPTGLGRKWILPLGRGMVILKLPVGHHPIGWRVSEVDHVMSVNTLPCVWVFGSQRFVSQLYCQFPKDSLPLSRPSRSSGNRECVCQAAPLAEAWLVYHSGLNCLFYVPVFIRITNGDWLIMWFLVGVESLLEPAQSLPTIYSLHMSQIFQFWFQIFYPTVSRSILNAHQTTCQFMVEKYSHSTITATPNTIFSDC